MIHFIMLCGFDEARRTINRTINSKFIKFLREKNLFKIINDTIYPTPPLGQDMTQGQFLSGVLQVSIQSFPSPRLVA